MKSSYTFNIRAALAGDINILQELSIVTFLSTYEKYNTEQDMQSYIAQHFTHEVLLDELKNRNIFFFLAVHNNEPVGYIKLRVSNELTQLKNKNSIELERIYVIKDLQGAGLGKQFIQYAINFAQEKEYDTIWLGVWVKNEKAISFYEKCGFEIFGEHDFILGKDKQTDWLMKKELKD